MCVCVCFCVCVNVGEWTVQKLLYNFHCHSDFKSQTMLRRIALCISMNVRMKYSSIEVNGKHVHLCVRVSLERAERGGGGYVPNERNLCIYMNM